MPTNNNKSNVARSAKKQSFKFKPWMAIAGVVVIAIVGIIVLRFSHASVQTNDMGNTSAYGNNLIYGTNFSVTACKNQSVNKRSVLLAQATPQSNNLNWANGDSLNFGIDEDYISNNSNNFLPLANVNVDATNFNGSNITINSRANYTGGTDKLNNNPAVKSYSDYAHTSFYLQEVHGGDRQLGSGNIATFGGKYRMPALVSNGKVTGVNGSPAGKVFEDDIAYCTYGFNNPTSLYIANVNKTNVLYVLNSDKKQTTIISDNGNKTNSPAAAASVFPTYTSSTVANITWSIDTAGNKVTHKNNTNGAVKSLSTIVAPTSVAAVNASTAWVTSNQSNTLSRVVTNASGGVVVDKTININKPNDVIFTTINVPDPDPAKPAVPTQFVVVTSGTKIDNSYVTIYDINGNQKAQTALPPKNAIGQYNYPPILSKPTGMASTGRYIWVINSAPLDGQAANSTSLVLVDPTNGAQLEALRR